MDAITFPVTSGTLDLATGRGEWAHSGGLELTSGSNKIQLLNFVIDGTEGSTKVTGLVVANGSVVGRAHLFDLTASGVTVPLEPQNDVLLVIPNVEMKLSETAAQTLNTLLNVETFTPGFDVATARVSLFVGRRVF